MLLCASIGQPGKAMSISLARGIVLCGVLVYLLPVLFGADAIWYVMPVTEFIVAAYVQFFMRKPIYFD